MMTEHQKDIVSQVNYSLRHRETCGLIGRSGVGKSYSLRYVLDKMEKEFPIVCASPTHNAAKIFFESTDRHCATLASLLKKRKEIDFATGEVLFDPQITLDLRTYLIVIDEASMVSEFDYNTLMTNFPRCVFLFVGDKGQLPPVKDEQFSIFDLSFPVFELEVNMRCGTGNRIYDLIESIYDSTDLEQTLKEFEFGGNVKRVKESDLNSDDLIITYTNSQRQYYNQLILGDLPISGNTKFIANENIAYDKKLKTYHLKNGEMFYPSSVSESSDRLSTGSFPFFFLKTKKKYVNYAPDRRVINAQLEVYKSKKNWKDFYKLQEKYPNVDLAYSMTSHRTQGCSFEYVSVDVKNILSIPDFKVRKSSLYVALSRASKELKLLM